MSDFVTPKVKHPHTHMPRTPYFLLYTQGCSPLPHARMALSAPTNLTELLQSN